MFYKFWYDVECKVNEYILIEVYWLEVLGRDVVWKE